MDIIRFVNSIADHPVTRLDLNDDIAWSVRYDGTDFSPPPLKASWASTLLSDGARLSASAYANRTIALSLDLKTTTVDGVAQELQTLWRELNRPTNFLMWQQVGMTHPVFFRTFRSSNTRVTQFPGDGTFRTVEVTLDAEPFAYGLRERLAEVQIYNDPAEGATLNANPYFGFKTESLGVGYWTVAGGTLGASGSQAHEGAASMVLTPDGVTTLVYTTSERVPVAAGIRIRLSAWVRCPVARNVKLHIDWYTAAGPHISTIQGLPVAVPANVWTLIDNVSAVAPQTGTVTHSVVMDGDGSGGPVPASHTLFIDEARMRAVGSAAEAVSAAGLNANSTYELDVTPWTGQNGTVERSVPEAFEDSPEGHRDTPPGVVKYALKLTPTGGLTPCAARSENIPVTPGVSYVAVARAFSPNGWTGVSMAIDWINSAGSTIYNDIAPVTALPADSWREFTWTAPAPPAAVAANFRVRMDGTPAATDVLYVDEARFHRAGNDGGMCFDVIAPKGDVETPLYLTVAAPDLINTSSEGPYQSAIAVRRRGTVALTPFVLQAEDMTLTSNSAVITNSTASLRAYANVNLNPLDVFTDVLSKAPYPSSAGYSVRGTYRVFMRYRYASTGDTATTVARLRWGRAGGSFGELIVNPEVALFHDGVKYQYADLGLVQIPAGYDPVYDGPTGSEIGTEGIYIGLQVKDSGTFAYTDIDVDCFLFAPADDRLALVRWPVTDDTVLPTDLIVDSAVGEVYARNPSGHVSTLPGAQLAGGPPMVSPGVTNRIYFIRDVGNDNTIGDTLNHSGTDRIVTPIAGYYWPRYLSVRGSA